MKQFLRLSATAITLALATPALSQGVPTVDVASIAKLTELLAESRLQLQEAIAQNLELDEQTRQLVEQVVLLQQQLDALQKGLSLEDLHLGDNFLRAIVPPDLTKILTALETGEFSTIATDGQISGITITDLLGEFYEQVGLDQKTVDDLVSSGNASTARIGTSAQNAAGLSIAAEQSSEQAEAGLERVDALVREIPETAGLKEAVDLNTRVTAELAIALANIWSMQAAQTISLGQAGVMDAATLADDQLFLDLSGAKD